MAAAINVRFCADVTSESLIVLVAIADGFYQNRGDWIGNYDAAFAPRHCEKAVAFSRSLSGRHPESP